MQLLWRKAQEFESPCASELNLFTGTAGVSPASSCEFIQGVAKPFNSSDVAFSEAGGTPAVPVKRLNLIGLRNVNV
jgi:hypothetical protein